MPKGLLVIISAPSGGGKDSTINNLLQKIPNSSRLITTTTRQPRPGDTNGNKYNFVSEESFKNKIKNEELIEYNVYAGNYYGTEKQILEDALLKNKVVFSQIEVNGKHNLDRLGIDNLSIFLLPESMDVLRKRIEIRGGIDETIIAERLKIAKEEVEKSLDYDYRIYNKEGHLAETIEQVEQIIEKELKKHATLDKTEQFR